MGRTRNETGSEYLDDGSNDFLENPYKNSFLNAFLDVIVLYNRKINGNPNLVGHAKILEMVFSIKNGSNNFLQTLCINLFWDAFLNALAIYYMKINGCPNLVVYVSELHILKKGNESHVVVTHKILFFKHKIKYFILWCKLKA